MAPLRDAATLWEEKKDGALKGRRYMIRRYCFQGGDHIFAGAHRFFQSDVREPESG